MKSESISFKLRYKINGDDRVIEMKPDRPIDLYYSGPFNWKGEDKVDGKEVAVVIPQRSVQFDPEPSDIKINDQSVRIDREKVVEEIEKTLDNNLLDWPEKD